ncbi:MAG: 4a-hydroxytetrahydrobiopterin dehydratase [Bacteroidia bacterium]
MWIEENNRLKKKFSFADFSQAFAFITQVALLAEKMNHHPEWSNIYNNVYIQLCTHDAGICVTEKDRKMAAEIDLILNSYSK